MIQPEGRHSRPSPPLRGGGSSSDGSAAYEESPAAVIRRHRQVVMQRFIVCETLVVAVMAASVIAGISGRFATALPTPLFSIVPIGAAIIGTIIPILFFGGPKSRPRTRR